MISATAVAAGDQEPPRLRRNLDWLGKQAVQLGIDRFSQAREGGDGVVDPPPPPPFAQAL